MTTKKQPTRRSAARTQREPAMDAPIGQDMIGQRVIARGKDSGAFAGLLVRREGQSAEIADCRRLWYWDGAASLSEIAAKGVSRPRQCKFPAPVERECIFDLIELIPQTEPASTSIARVPAWTAH